MIRILYMNKNAIVFCSEFFYGILLKKLEKGKEHVKKDWVVYMLYIDDIHSRLRREIC